jgi:DNA-binding beta-propeller fold protein YncE
VALRLTGHVELPPHRGAGAFDHAAVHHRGQRLYVAHTANDAVDVVDTAAQRYIASLEKLTAVAGALVSEERDRVFTSNRGENTVAIFAPGEESAAPARIAVGVRPNGLAYDPGRDLLLAANVGDPARPESFTATLVDVASRSVVEEVPVAGRTRWAVFDAAAGAFYVNIMAPPWIQVIDARTRTVTRTIVIPAEGPHGLDLDPARRRLFCACDAGALVEVDLESFTVTTRATLSGAPDVIFFNARLGHLYVAVGEPGVIDVLDTESWRRVQTVETERGAHTLAFDAQHDTVYAFLPESHRAAVYVDAVSASG